MASQVEREEDAALERRDEQEMTDCDRFGHAFWSDWRCEHPERRVRVEPPPFATHLDYLPYAYVPEHLTRCSKGRKVYSCHCGAIGYPIPVMTKEMAEVLIDWSELHDA